MLIRTVTDKGDACGLPCVLRATAAGTQVYQKLGWKVAERSKIMDHDGNVICEVPVMIREPPHT
jgi:hypothetical protein